MELSEARGTLMAIGGGEIKKGDAPLLKEFVKLARGPKARVVVMTAATDHPEEVAAEYIDAFKALGVDDVSAVDVSARADAEDPEALELIKKATGLFFTGGDQLHITTLIGGSEMQKLIGKRYEKGLVVGGTSAGAAMMSNSMIVGGGGKDAPRAGEVQLGPGMDLLIGAVIDTHFFQRGRFGRLLAAVAHYPQDLGIGLDEETGMVVKGTELEVFGEGSVTLIDAGSMSYTSLPYVEDGSGLSLFGVQVHVLSEGHKFDLANRRPILKESGAKKARASESGDDGKTSKTSKARAGKKGKGK
jgi:cyanophycinase